jgi:hypothetical protein
VAAPLSGAGSTTPTKRLSKQLETMDLRHDTDTAALRQTDSRAAVAPVVPRGVGDGEDQLSLQSMHSNISAVLVHVPPSSSSATKKVSVCVSLSMSLCTHACMHTHTHTNTGSPDVVPASALCVGVAVGGLLKKVRAWVQAVEWLQRCLLQ